MSNPRRKNLRDRNAEAIAGPAAQRAPVTAAVEEPTRAQAAPVAEAAKATAAPAEPPARGTTSRIGIYFHPEQFDTAKAAYLADWQAGGVADTFARWIAGALDEHARRTPQQRTQLARPQERADTRGNSRSFNLPVDTVARMRSSINADQTAGRWPSDSAWCGDAIAAAVNQAKQRAGGNLPTPPARLPNRLLR